MSKESKKRKQNAESSSGNDNKKKKKGHWVMSMLNSVDDPQLFVEDDEKITVIKDKYPKAEIHFLVIPKEDVSSIKAVTTKHLPLLEHMEEVAYRLLERNDCKNKTFRIGYHAEPSMVRLHLHMLSDDMNSPFLKTKKHWNSFNTDFFLLSKSKHPLEQIFFEKRDLFRCV